MPRILSLTLILAVLLVNDLSAQVMFSRKKKSMAPAIEVSADVKTQMLMFDLKNMAKNEYSIFVFNTEGRNVITESMTNGYARNFEMGLKLSNLEANTYYYSFVTKQGAVMKIGKFDLLDDRSTIMDDDFGVKINTIGGSETASVSADDENETVVPMIIRDIYNERYFSMVIVNQEDEIPVGFDTSRQLTPGIYYVVGSGSQQLEVDKMLIR